MANKKYKNTEEKKPKSMNLCVGGGSCMEGGNVKTEKSVKFYSRLGRKTDVEHA